MNTDRIKEIQQETAYPESVSVQQALLKVWNETAQEQLRIAAVIKSVCIKCGKTCNKENSFICAECSEKVDEQTVL